MHAAEGEDLTLLSSLYQQEKQYIQIEETSSIRLRSSLLASTQGSQPIAAAAAVRARRLGLVQAVQVTYLGPVRSLHTRPTPFA